jgi:hypothetical protein
LVAHREKMVRMSTKAKNRLATVLHRNHLVYPGDHQSHMYHPDAREWWEKLSVSAIEKLRIRADLDTVEFAQKQVKNAEEALGELAAKDERVPLLVQLPGCGLLNAITILAAVGTISRFEDAKHLVGYAGLGTRVHDSGMTHHNGRITKAGRKDLRSAMVSMANTAVEYHPFWKKEFERISARLGRSKAIVATLAPAVQAQVLPGDCWWRSGMCSRKKKLTATPLRWMWRARSLPMLTGWGCGTSPGNKARSSSRGTSWTG